MDRNTILGIAAMILFGIIWSVYFTPSKEERDAQKKQIESQKQLPLPKSDTLVSREAGKITPAKDDTLSSDLKLKGKYGSFAPAVVEAGTEEKVLSGSIDINTEVLSAKISPLGASITQLSLNKFKTYDKKDLFVVSPSKENISRLDFKYFSKDGSVRTIDTDKLHFKYISSGNQLILKGDEKKSISFRAEIGQDTFIEKRYTFSGNTYDVRQEWVLKNLNNIIAENTVTLNEKLSIPQSEKSESRMLLETNIIYQNAEDGDEERLSLEVAEPVKLTTEHPVKWVAYRSQFFTQITIPDKQFNTGAQFKAFPKSGLTPKGHIKDFTAGMTLNLPKKNIDTLGFTYYYGPNDINLLGNLDSKLSEHSLSSLDLGRLVQLGWIPFRWISLSMFYIFHFLENFTTNYGLIIFLLAILIKAATWYFSYKQHISTQKMQLVNSLPEIKEIETKFPDSMEANQEKQKVYSKYGISTMSGCFTAVLQMPVLVAMFFFFPQSIQLRQKPLWWADDLSSYDAFWQFNTKFPIIGDHLSLFAILSTVFTLLMTFLQQRRQGSSGPAQLKFLGYFMPLFFFYILNDYSAGLSYYNFVFTVMSIAQTYLFYAFVSEKKLMDELKKVKSKPQKKSKLQSFIEIQQQRQAELNKMKQDQHRRR